VIFILLYGYKLSDMYFSGSKTNLLQNIDLIIVGGLLYDILMYEQIMGSWSIIFEM